MQQQLVSSRPHTLRTPFTIRVATLLATLGALVALLFAAPPVHAATANYGMALAPTNSRQLTPMVSEVNSPSWGTYICWTDYRNGAADIWWAIADSAGVAPMPTYYLNAPPPGEQKLVAGSRGTYMATLDSISDYDIALTASRTIGWGGYGSGMHYSVVSAPGDQVAPRTLLLPNGTPLVVYQDNRLGLSNTDIYIMGISPFVPQPPTWFPAPVAVCTVAGNQTAPVICSDGAYGGIVAWVDTRSGTADLFAQHVDYNGAPLWTVNGRSVCTATAAQGSVEIVSDGAGGAILAWVDYRNGNADIYAQRLDSLGNPMWTPNGIPVCAIPGTQDGLVLNADFNGGASLAWVDGRNGQDIYADHLDAGGYLTWSVNTGSPNGVLLSTNAVGLQSGLRADSDSTGFYVVWEDRSSGDSNIHALGYAPLMGLLWDVVVCAAPGDQTAPSILADCAARRGGAIVTWQDARVSAARPQAYAQRIRVNGTFAYPDSDRPKLSAVRDVRADQGGAVSLSFTGGALDRVDNRLISEFRIWRRVAPTSAIVASAPVTGEATALSGRYIARRPEGALASSAATTYWEAIATLPAQQLEGYAYTASTTQDSIAGSNPYTAFFVTALTSDRYVYYESNVDSSYSVDNLGPAMVQLFSGYKLPTATALHWAKSAEEDFASYRVYRGATSDFAPGASNMVADKPDTGFVDAVAGTHFYKIVAVDIHGNASPIAMLAPSSTASVETPVAAQFSLASPFPNPVKIAARIAYSLPRGGDVSLEMYDIQGARVRTLVHGAQAPGEHSVRWDGRDEAGAPLANGVYFYRLATADGSLTRRLVLSN